MRRRMDRNGMVKVVHPTMKVDQFGDLLQTSCRFDLQSLSPKDTYHLSKHRLYRDQRKQAVPDPWFRYFPDQLPECGAVDTESDLLETMRLHRNFKLEDKIKLYTRKVMNSLNIRKKNSKDIPSDVDSLEDEGNIKPPFTKDLNWGTRGCPGPKRIANWIKRIIKKPSSEKEGSAEPSIYAEVDLQEDCCADDHSEGCVSFWEDGDAEKTFTEKTFEEAVRYAIYMTFIKKKVGKPRKVYTDPAIVFRMYLSRYLHSGKEREAAEVILKNKPAQKTKFAKTIRPLLIAMREGNADVTPTKKDFVSIYQNVLEPEDIVKMEEDQEPITSLRTTNLQECIQSWIGPTIYRNVRTNQPLIKTPENTASEDEKEDLTEQKPLKNCYLKHEYLRKQEYLRKKHNATSTSKCYKESSNHHTKVDVCLNGNDIAILCYCNTLHYVGKLRHTDIVPLIESAKKFAIGRKDLWGDQMKITYELMPVILEMMQLKKEKEKYPEKPLEEICEKIKLDELGEMLESSSPFTMGEGIWEDIESDLDLHPAEPQHSDFHQSELRQSGLLQAHAQQSDVYQAEARPSDLHQAKSRESDLQQTEPNVEYQISDFHQAESQQTDISHHSSSFSDYQSFSQGLNLPWNTVKNLRNYLFHLKKVKNHRNLLEYDNRFNVLVCKKKKRVHPFPRFYKYGQWAKLPREVLVEFLKSQNVILKKSECIVQYGPFVLKGLEKVIKKCLLSLRMFGIRSKNLNLALLLYAQLQFKDYEENLLDDLIFLREKFKTLNDIQTVFFQLLQLEEYLRKTADIKRESWLKNDEDYELKTYISREKKQKQRYETFFHKNIKIKENNNNHDKLDDFMYYNFKTDYNFSNDNDYSSEEGDKNENHFLDNLCSCGMKREEYNVPHKSPKGNKYMQVEYHTAQVGEGSTEDKINSPDIKVTSFRIKNKKARSVKTSSIEYISRDSMLQLHSIFNHGIDNFNRDHVLKVIDFLKADGHGEKPELIIDNLNEKSSESSNDDSLHFPRRDDGSEETKEEEEDEDLPVDKDKLKAADQFLLADCYSKDKEPKRHQLHASEQVLPTKHLERAFYHVQQFQHL